MEEGKSGKGETLVCVQPQDFQRLRRRACVPKQNPIRVPYINTKDPFDSQYFNKNSLELNLVQ